MFQNDWIGLLIVYLYVLVLIFGTEKIADKYPQKSRKILHILTGNVVLILPLFQTKEVMTLLAAGPFLVFTFLMSDHSPVDLVGSKVSQIGHGMGLVYYSLSWVILAYAFFNQKIIIAIGMLATAYGDGMASLIGSEFGGRKFNIGGGEKSLEGSLSMFVFTFISVTIIIAYYAFMTGSVALQMGLITTILIISIISTLVEATTPKGLDNLTVPLTASILFWFLV